MKTITKLWIFIAILMVLSPLGLLVPAYFRSGAAWGEWGVDELKELAGYIPKGLERLASLWRAPIPDYAFKCCEGKSLLCQSCAYMLSAAMGILATAAVIFLLGSLLRRKK